MLTKKKRKKQNPYFNRYICKQKRKNPYILKHQLLILFFSFIILFVNCSSFYGNHRIYFLPSLEPEGVITRMTCTVKQSVRPFQRMKNNVSTKTCSKYTTYIFSPLMTQLIKIINPKT